MFQRTKLSTGLIIAFGGSCALMALPSVAQDTGTQRVEITGSTVKRVDAETPSPVQVITSDDLQKSGFTTIAEVLQNLTANGQGTLSQGFSQAFAGGASGISLRGLTTAYTLVLIDGHRMAPYPLTDDNQRSFVDVSNLPFDAIERVEVLKDGASAVYGSDAMAGVVNVILRKNFSGTRLAADAGFPTEGGGRSNHASVTHGFGDYDADGYTGYFNLEFRHQDRITYDQRKGRGDWQNLDWTAQGGTNRTPGVINAYVPQPSTLSPYLVNSNGTFTADPSSTFFYGPACPSFAALTAGSCAYQNPLAEVTPQTQNANALLSLSKKISNDFRFDLKASLFDSRSEQYPAGGLQTYPQSSNPLIGVSAGVPAFIGTPGIASITVPANYPGNPFGAPANVYGVIPGAPTPHTNFDSKATRVVGELTGSFGEWDIGASLGYTHILTKQSSYGLINVPTLNDALNRAVLPFNVTGGNTAADLAAIFPSDSVDDTSTLSFAEVHVGRSVAKLPGGDLALSAGASYISTKIDSPAPSLIADGIVSGNNAFGKGNQDDSAAYVELVAPVLKSLEVDGDLRFDHISTAGNATTPKLGFKWKPVQQVALRGTVSRGFRAPNEAESGESGSLFLFSRNRDPLLCPGHGTAAGDALLYCSFTPEYLQSSTAGLKPERSLSETLGLIVEPIPGWSSTFDLYQIRINDQIISNPGDFSQAVRSPTPITTVCSDGNGGQVSCSVNPVVYIPADYINANSVKTSGWELGSRYRLGMGEFGGLSAEVDWSHMMSYILNTGGVAYQLAGTHGPIIVGGDTGNPKNRVQLTLTWDKGPLQVAAAVNYIGSFDLTDPSQGITDCDSGASVLGNFPDGGVPSQYCKVKSFTTTNLSMHYKMDKSWTFKGSIDNLFNTQPPVDQATYGGGQLPFNPSMHLAGAIGRVVNIGAIYNF